jgi:hypothetical protein
MNRNRDHPVLRLVVDNEEPRKYAQSMSGRSRSQRTAPELSRSRATTSASPKSCSADIALRRYPMVVPQRLAYRDCSDCESDLRNERSSEYRSSITAILPMGNNRSIPAGHLPAGKPQYADVVDLQATRRKRLQMLVDEYGTQTALADKLGLTPNYISRALKGTKKIGEDWACKVEQATGKPHGWLSQSDDARQSWPFDFDRKHWDNLPEDERRQLSRNFTRLVMGTEAEVASRNRKRKAS